MESRAKSAGATRIASFIVILLHALLVYLLISGSLGIFYNDAMHRLGPGTDFRVYYEAGRRFLAGGSVFDVSTAFGYRYHPALAVVVGTLLGGLSLKSAYFVWVALTELALFSLVPVIHRRVSNPRDRLSCIAALLLFSPVLLDLFMGQCTVLAMVTCAHALDAVERDRGALASVWLATSVMIKPIALVAFPLLIVSRRWRVLAGAVTAIIVLAAAYFLFDPDGLATFHRLNFEAVPKRGWVVHAGHHGLHGFVASLLARLGGIDTRVIGHFRDFGPVLQFSLILWPLLFIIPSAWMTHRLRHTPDALLWVWTATFFLGYKDVWEHTYAFALPGLFLLWQSGFPHRTLFLVCTLGLALPTLFVFYDLPLPPGPHDPEHQWSDVVAFIHHAQKPAFALGLYVGCALWARSGSDRDHAHPIASRTLHESVRGWPPQ